MGLFFLGRRRPTSLADIDQFKEDVSRPPAQPIEHRNAKGVDGGFVGRGAERRANRAADKPGKHRADS